MIKAVYRQGNVQLLDSVPSNWREGEELIIDAVAADEVPNETFEQWVAEIEAATAGISDEDHARFMAALAEVEAESKALGRREMERSDRLFAEDDELRESKDSA